MTSHSFLALSTAVLVSLVGAVGAAEARPDPLTVKLSAYMTADTSVVVRARVEPDARSRELTIEWIADDLSGGSHAITLEGASAAVMHQYALTHISPGQYVVTAILRLSDGTTVRRSANLSVVGVSGPNDGRATGTDGASAERARPVSRN